MTPRPRSSPALLAGWLLALGACAPVAYQEPEVTVGFHLKENTGLASSYLVAELPESTAFPITTPRAYNTDQLCFVMSVTGSGLPSAFAEEEDLSCESRFPGLGQMSAVFAWGDTPKIKVAFGDRRFDVLAFPRHVFPDGTCPMAITSEERGEGAVFFADGQEISFPAGSDGPVRLSSSQLYVGPGRNMIDLEIERGDGDRLIGQNYGCRRFDVFPRPTRENVYETGLRSMFFEVQCPSDADSIRVETDADYISPVYRCDPRTGTVKIASVPLNEFDLDASDWGWFQPTVKITTLAGDSIVGASRYKIKYSSEGHYAPVLDSGSSGGLSWPIDSPNREFRLLGTEGGRLVVHERNLTSGALREISAGIEWDDEAIVNWDGEEPAIESIAESALFDAALLSGPTVGWKHSSTNQVRVRRCPAGQDFCSSGWQGLAAEVSSASRAAFDVVNSGGQSLLFLVDSPFNAPRARIVDLSQTGAWAVESFGNLVAGSSGAAFRPAWVGPRIGFVKAQRRPAGLADPLLSRGANLVAGGAAEDPDYPGLRRAVAYRSHDGGANWHQVYRGPLGTELVDGGELESPSGTSAYVFLERYSDYFGDEGVRVVAQDASKTGF